MNNYFPKIRLIFCCLFIHSLTYEKTAFALSHSADTAAGHIQQNNSGLNDDEWISGAIIYEVTPYLFVQNAKYPDITAKLPELVKLGINTLWIQPVFRTYGGGQGYDIIDYFSLREDLGSEAELGQLIQTAKTLGLKVIFDFVANHTSIHHPYAVDRMQNGSSSPYFDYYQSRDDGAAYSSYYNMLPTGFYYYFWSDLVNLNYNNEDVRRWIINASKYWIEKFDIDGYRFDAAWGFISRSSDFTSLLVQELKALKPSVLLLAEDKGSTTIPYEHGFQVAYDWAKDTSWVSQWAWEYSYSENNSLTIFNHPSVAQRASLLRKALFEDYQSGIRLRYLENNDTHRFTANHNQAVTAMASTLMFALPGIPMIYNGQEIGFSTFPYVSGPIFQRGRTIESLNPSLFRFYSRLAGMRKSHPALSASYIKDIPVGQSQGVVAFHRRDDSEDIIVVINMGPSPANAELDLTNIISFSGNRLSLKDLILDQDFTSNVASLNKIRIPVGGTTTRILKINKTASIGDGESGASIRPNPGNGKFMLFYTSQQPVTLSLVLFDQTGRKIYAAQKALASGETRIELDISGRAPGMYFLHLTGGEIKRVLPVIISKR